MIAKNHNIAGRVGGQFRLEFVNLTNTIKFANGAESRVGNPSFGRLTTQGGFSRRTQLAYRVTW